MSGVVFDCMVFVQAIASKGPAFRCYQRVTTGQVQLLASLETLDELRSVLERPDLQRKLPGITPDRVNSLMHHLSELAVLIHPVPTHVSFPPDPKDEPYIELAVEARATSLITRDRALLRLSDPNDPLFAVLAEHPKLQVLVPESFLEPPKNPDAGETFP